MIQGCPISSDSSRAADDDLKLQEAGLLDNDSEETPVEADGDDYESANEDGSEATEEQKKEKVTEKAWLRRNRQNPFALHLVKLRNRALKFLVHFSLVCLAKYSKSQESDCQ